MKKITNLIIGLILITFFSINSCKEKNQNTLSTKNVYKIHGFEITEPSSKDWNILIKSEDEITFSKNLDSNESTIYMNLLKIPKFDNQKELLNYLENYVDNEVSGLKMVSIHFNGIKYKQLICMEYDGLYMDTANVESSKQFLSIRGLLTKNPINPELINYIKLINKSPQKDIPDAVLNDYQHLIESLQFKN